MPRWTIVFPAQPDGRTRPGRGLPRPLAALLTLLLATLVAATGNAVPATAATSNAGQTSPPSTAFPITRSWALVDADTGNVVASSNARTRMRVASTFKILTALVVRAHVPLSERVPISARAAAMPALKINVKPGQVWTADSLFHSMLIASANDAAVALAEQAGGGSLPGFDAAAAAEARTLHLADRPVLHDPAGLDDDYSFEGGNLISARDLAIAARAFLDDPYLAAIAETPRYAFHGGDGQDHEVQSHNAFLSAYPGAVGLKTGYTERSGSSLVAAARRKGRTLVAVVIDSSNTVAAATQLLDRGFATPVAAEPTTDKLPPTPPSITYLGPGTSTRPGMLPLRSSFPVSAGPGSVPFPVVVLLVIVGLVGLVLARRRQVVVRQLNASRQAGAARRPAPRRPPARRAPPPRRAPPRRQPPRRPPQGVA
jgi:D-alanyl-D-alanine carboxypeptidase (penicillin-binding protein 5/6)